MHYKILNQTGHSTETYGTTKMDLAKAEARFKELTGLGFTPAKEMPDGAHEVSRDFDPEANTIFFPQLKGG